MSPKILEHKLAIFNIKKLFLLLLTATLIVACTNNRTSASDVKDDNVIDSNNAIEAPYFELTSTQGDIVSLNDFSDKIIVLHIATTWCPYCNAEAPHLLKLSEDYKDKGVAVLMIDVKESKELVQTKLIEKYKLNFPVLLDTDGRVAASFAPKDILPELARDEIMLASNIVIDKEGKIRYMSLLDTKNFDAELNHVKKLLNGML